MPRNAYSFCGAWHTGSKLILIAVMLRGRHRGLPVAIDKAVLLPDETLAWAEEEDAQMRKEAGQGVSGGLRRRLSGLDVWEGNSNGKANGNAGASASGRSPERAGHDGDPNKMV
jgi:Cation transport protein